jgi:hypothetical protein
MMVTDLQDCGSIQAQNRRNEFCSELLIYITKPIYYIVMDLVNELQGNSSVNTVQHATIEEAVFSVVPTDAPIDWLDSDHVTCVYCRSMSVPLLCK